MLTVYVDADACPVKEEVYKVAKRYGLHVILVANSLIRAPQGDWAESILVSGGFDAADDWIVEHIQSDDILVSSDLPLVDRCLQKGAWGLGPKGRLHTEESIADALATRHILETLRDQGERTGGPAPFQPKDRSRFLSRMDEVVQAIRRRRREAGDPPPPPPPPPTPPAAPTPPAPPAAPADPSDATAPTPPEWLDPPEPRTGPA
ncbi:MAG: YaiI/YqxD family protein [Planctomycetota bacterium]